MAKLLETERLIIREFIHDDILLLMEYSKEKTRQNELPDEIFDTPVKAEALIEMCTANYSKGKYPLPYAVDLKKSNRMIGHILLSAIHEGVEIGYFISEHYQGNGYASESIRAFAPWAKATFHLDTLYGESKKSNIASWKALEKAGFVFKREKELNFFGTMHTFKEYTC